MAVAAWVGILLGIFGSYLLLRTLLYTRDAAVAARQTLKESERMTNLVRQEQRPWIFIEREIPCDLSEINEVLRLNWFYKLQNIGKTPAYGFRMEQELFKTDKVVNIGDGFEKFKDKLIRKVDGWGSEIIIPNQPNRNLRSSSQLNAVREYISGEGENLILFAGCVYRTSRNGDVGFDIQAYRIREVPNRLGPMAHELIHIQWNREVE